MEGFGKIVGHEKIIAHLQNAILTDKVSHAYIFSGEQGTGKKLLASVFAMTLQCEKKEADPCLQCDFCKRAMSKNHPDIIRVTHEKPGTISIEEIRRQLVNDMDVKPYMGPYKIYIIDEADKMTTQAQNALLKTIEEPPVYGVVLLLTRNIDGLLPTIISRCVRLDLKMLPDYLVKDYLMDRLHIPDYQAEIDASFAQGSIGRAKQAASSEEFTKMTKDTIQLLKRIGEMEVYELIDVMKNLSGEKDIIYDYLDLFLLWFRDVLMFKATREVDHLVFKQEIGSIREQAKERSYEGLEKILDALGKAKARLKANVNFDLVMELLFLTIREK